MSNDGRYLEGLVAFVETTLLPKGFEVTTNRRIYNDEGIQIAELDVEIRGRIGSTNIAWLIECRDRPGRGPAPTSWIEQLVGRRTRFALNKVTAVSTTGFSPGATDFARAQGIELREVQDLLPEAMKNWLLMGHMESLEQRAMLHNAVVTVDEVESEERVSAAKDVVAAGDGTPILKCSARDERAYVRDAFLAIVERNSLFADVVPNGPAKQVTINVQYTNDSDHFVIETPLGPVRVRSILFSGELSIVQTSLPLSRTAEYRHVESDAAISQVATFAPQRMFGKDVALEFHKIAESGETHMTLRVLGDTEGTQS